MCVCVHMMCIGECVCVCVCVCCMYMCTYSVYISISISYNIHVFVSSFNLYNLGCVLCIKSVLLELTC